MFIHRNLFPLILAAGFISTSAFAQAAPAPTAEQKAARAEIETLTKRIEELAKKLDGNTKVQVMVVEKSADGQSRTVERRIISSAPGGQSPQWTEDKRMQRGEMHQAGARRVGLGIVMSPNAGSAGVKVAAVSPKGPAKAAGLQAGDVITSIDGKPVSGKDQAGMQQARAALANLKEGQSVKIGYVRAGKNAAATLKAAKIEPEMVVDREVRRMGPGPAPEMAYATRWHGLQMAEVNPQLGRYFGASSGVLVLSPKKEFPQLQAGDVITKVDGKPVANARDVLINMRGRKEGEKITVAILRDRKAQTISVTAPKPQPMNAPRPPMPPMPPPPPAPPAPPPRTALFLGDDGASHEFEFASVYFGDSIAAVDFSGFDAMEYDGDNGAFSIEIDGGE
jgi:C-terminal processing protease CtpA/Prc